MSVKYFWVPSLHFRLNLCKRTRLPLDLDFIRTFPNARESWSINTLDEAFKDDMDCAVEIQRQLRVMKALHDAGVRTTCFISPIFPEITDVPAVIRRAKNQENLVWMENLNLWGSYKQVILDYIGRKYLQLVPPYDAIYRRRDRDYRADLEAWMPGCGDFVRRRDCCMSGTMISSSIPSTIRPLWLTTFSTRRSFLRPRSRRNPIIEGQIKIH